MKPPAITRDFQAGGPFCPGRADQAARPPASRNDTKQDTVLPGGPLF